MGPKTTFFFPKAPPKIYFQTNFFFPKPHLMESWKKKKSSRFALHSDIIFWGGLRWLTFILSKSKTLWIGKRSFYLLILILMFGLTSGGDEDYIFCIFDIRLEGGGALRGLKKVLMAGRSKRGRKLVCIKKKKKCNQQKSESTNNKCNDWKIITLQLSKKVKKKQLTK